MSEWVCEWVLTVERKQQASHQSVLCCCIRDIDLLSHRHHPYPGWVRLHFGDTSILPWPNTRLIHNNWHKMTSVSWLVTEGWLCVVIHISRRPSHQQAYTTTNIGSSAASLLDDRIERRTDTSNSLHFQRQFSHSSSFSFFLAWVILIQKVF